MTQWQLLPLYHCRKGTRKGVAILSQEVIAARLEVSGQKRHHRLPNVTVICLHVYIISYLTLSIVYVMMFISVHFFTWWVLFTFIDSLVVWQFLGRITTSPRGFAACVLRRSARDRVWSAGGSKVHDLWSKLQVRNIASLLLASMWILQSSQAHFIDRRQDECHVRNSSRSKPQGRAEWLGGGLGRQAFLAENQLHFQAYPPLPELSELAADANATAIELVPYHISDS